MYYKYAYLVRKIKNVKDSHIFTTKYSSVFAYVVRIYLVS